MQLSPSPPLASGAWRCVACGRLYLFVDKRPKPEKCASCGSTELTAVSPNNPRI